MARDEGLLRKVGDRVATYPHTYDQYAWLEQDERCGTVGCLAGHTVLLHPEFRGVIADELVLVGDAVEHLPVVAREQLGLTEYEADVLFHADWQPAGSGPLHERVRDALHALADGASIADVTHEGVVL